MTQEFQWPSFFEAESHIRQELQRLGLAFKEDRGNFAIVCPYPHPGGGANSHFNYRIKKDGKTSFCFVCKTTGSWQKIAGDIGASKFNSNGLLGEEAGSLNMGAALKRRQLLSLEDDDVAEIPDGMTPWLGGWRGFSESFLTQMQAQRWLQPWHGAWVERIWFPCLQWQDFVGYVSRRLDTEPEMRYYNAPWMKSKEVLFGFDAARALKSDAVAVTEGPVDALRLLAGGIPAVAILGTPNIAQKEVLLHAGGWKRGYVVFDADTEGRKAAPLMMARMQVVMPTEMIGLPEGFDPGKLDTAQVAWLREHMRV